MATNFGFMPVLEGQRYFISYKSEDTERIGEIARKLNQMGVPMWYDYGIEKGKRWSAEINRNIEECEAFILFATKALFAAQDTWVRKEFKLAIMSQKRKYIVWLDDINPYEKPNDVHIKLRDWYLDLDDLQGIKEYGGSSDYIAWRMVTELNLINGMTPQPPSPIYQPPVQQTKPEPKSTQPPPPAKQPQPVKKTPPAPPVQKMNVSVGDRIPFGQYPQGADGQIQPLMWRVLAVEDGKALLITDKLIDCVRYNEVKTDVTWETCTLRKWMNNDFISKAFNSSQQAQIVTVTNHNPSNPVFRTNGGNATQDRIFALSIDEAEKYFRDDDDRMAAVTEYATKQGAYICDDKTAKKYGWKNSLPTGEKTGWWWLRSPGLDSFSAARVDTDGNVSQDGSDVNNNYGAVRPAFWLNL